MLKSFSVYLKGPILPMSFYGFMSGMSLLLSGNTLNFWLANLGVSMVTLGLFSCVLLPYGLKYFLALFVDRVSLPWLSKRFGAHKSWLILSQGMLGLSLLGLSRVDPLTHLWQTAALGFAIALSAVVQDIVLDAHRVRLLSPEERGPGSALYTIGYRLGMLFSGAGVIYASVSLEWSVIFLLLSGVYALSAVCLSAYYREVERALPEPLSVASQGFLYKLLVTPFANFLTLKNFLWVIAFILLYRLPDHMLSMMLNPFLLQTGFSASDIATVSKFFGTIMVILGGVISGPLMARWGMGRSLLGFSVIHMLGHGLFIIFFFLGKNMEFLYFVTAYEAFTGGMLMTAYIAFMASLCQGRYVATQYALMSSGMGLSRVFLPALSGLVVEGLGWLTFFGGVTALSLACSLFVWRMPKRLYALEKPEGQ